jgi:alanine racemase
MHSISRIRTWTSGEWLSIWDADSSVEHLSIDTRSLENPAQSVFIALSTAVRDGHNFLADAYYKGVRNFIVSRKVETTSFPECNFILVRDTITALQQIAIGHRKLFTLPVIGITGSNGKTVVKEWLGTLLDTSYAIVRSPKSYNSQIGVPLSVWQITKDHRLGIFEAGISQTGEMEHLEKIIQPTIGVFTNIGEAHSDGFLTMRQKINEKLLLFRNVDHIVYCTDHADVHECIAQYMHQTHSGKPDSEKKLFTWSTRHEATLHITGKNVNHGKTTISASYRGNNINITIPFTDDASVENAIHCWCVMLLLNVKQETIEGRMDLLQPVSMRLEMRQGINDSTIINDSYNSDLTSLQIALNFLEQQKQHAHHTVIMSDILQPGKSDTELYEQVAGYISRRNIHRFIGIGPALYKHKAAFRKHRKIRSIFFRSTEHFLENFHLLTFEREAILLKGARVFTFEKIGVLLEQKIHQTVLTIDLSALKHNLDCFRSLLRPDVKTMAMVKAFAYGSGSYEIASLLQYSGVDYLAVAYTDEGVGLRKAGIRLPIMVMSPDVSSFDRMIAWKLEPEIYNTRSFLAMKQVASTLKVKEYPIHIKLDTGMHRLGFGPEDTDQLIALLQDTPELKVASIFSHLAASDDPDEDPFTAKQAERFDILSKKIVTSLTYTPLMHLSNSSGISRHGKLQHSMVRLGVGLYGIDNSDALGNKLRQISTLRTSIAQIRDIAAGESVGYGHRNIQTESRRIAVICIGYADGYPRSMGNGKAHVLINETVAPTIGSICMDMCMVDITSIPDVREGDDAIVFGPQLPVSKLAEWAGTIPYEIMTGISQRVKRVYINGD